MPDFAYVARDTGGKRVAGRVSAGSRPEALALLDQRALFPVEVKQEEKKQGLLKSKRVSPQRMASTYGQLGDLLRSGVPLLKSLSILEKQSSHPGLSAVLADVKAHVEEGTTLAEALARHPKVVSEMAISMVRAGGEGGFLEEALDRVSDFTEQQEDLKSRTLGAIAYPAFLGVVGSVVVTVLIVFFVPRFATMFERLKERGELPVATEWLLAFSQFLGSYGWILVVLAIFAGIFARNGLKTAEGRRFLDKVKIKIPMAGSIFLNLAVARFCRVLGTLLKNGVPILKSLDISSDATGNRVLSESVRQAAENISAGESLAGPLAASGNFPMTVVEMIAVAEEANQLDSVLITIAEGLERRTWRQLELFVRLLEPLMLLILAGVVLVVVMALLLPVMKMSTSL
jgi:general secretion pathway protein F/type IV pilus assembly protein PilC